MQKRCPFLRLTEYNTRLRNQTNGFSKPLNKFIRDMVYGIQATGERRGGESCE